jgi:regulator of protease activity HflC (stomatin/prohibitin superfamily)
MTDFSHLSLLVCLLSTFVLTCMIMLASSLRIVQEEKRLKVYRLGRYFGLKGPGLVLLIPFVDRGILVDAGNPIEHANSLARMAGAQGEARTTIYPEGEVQVGGQVWPAISDRPVKAGQRVRIKRILLDVEGTEEY